jgi:three-Cys-motif partner protein
MQRKDKSGWTIQKAKKILKDDVVNTKGMPYPCHDFSLVKLIVLGQWSNVYTTIIPKHFSVWRYIDLMAGSGTSHIKEANCDVAGSVFVAKAFAREPYSSYVLVEKDRERFEALKQRSAGLGSPYEVYNDDANNLVDQIFANQPDDVHNFVFIDNEGFNISWRSIEKILNTESDVLINYPTTSFPRTTKERTAGCLDNFFGDTSWRNIVVSGEKIDRDQALELYKEKLSKTFGFHRLKKPFVSNIRVGSQSYFYDLILCCKYGKYVNAWEDLKSKTYWKDPNIARNALDFLSGKSSILDEYIQDYLSPEEKQKERKDKSITDYLI